MSLSTTQYGYIVDPMVPFTDDKGKTIKNGFIRVFMAGTSTPVLTYRNYDGATNQEKIELDNSGRVKHNVIGSKGSLYKVVVYNILHSQENPLLTVDKIAVLGASINATGATIVTGLDSVTVQEENFLKATVEGTGVELALDPTEVTSELSTTAAAVTAAPDYVVPLLDKTGEGDSKKISLANLFKFALDWISRLATTITSFASGDFIAVSNPTDGTRKMSKDTLLQLTAQNALAGNVVEEFDPTRTSENKYLVNESVVYEGKVYTFKVDHYGAWNASHVFRNNSEGISSIISVKRPLTPCNLCQGNASIDDTGWSRANDYKGSQRCYVDIEHPVHLEKGEVAFVDSKMMSSFTWNILVGIKVGETYTYRDWSRDSLVVATAPTDLVYLFRFGDISVLSKSQLETIASSICVSSSAFEVSSTAIVDDIYSIKLRKGTYDFYGNAMNYSSHNNRISTAQYHYVKLEVGDIVGCPGCRLFINYFGSSITYEPIVQVSNTGWQDNSYTITDAGVYSILVDSYGVGNQICFEKFFIERGGVKVYPNEYNPVNDIPVDYRFFHFGYNMAFDANKVPQITLASKQYCTFPDHLIKVNKGDILIVNLDSTKTYGVYLQFVNASTGVITERSWNFQNYVVSADGFLHLIVRFKDAALAGEYDTIIKNAFKLQTMAAASNLSMLAKDEKVNVVPVKSQKFFQKEGIAHRGFCSVAPENTLPAFRLAAELGFKWVECDVQFTSDNVAVICHDTTIDRTSDGTGAVSSMTLAQLREYDFGSWKSEDYTGTPIPTLENFLMCCNRLGLNAVLDFSNTGGGSPTTTKLYYILGLVKKCGMSGRTMLLTTQFKRTIADVESYGCDVVSVSYLEDHITNLSSDAMLSLKDYRKRGYAVALSTAYNYISDDVKAFCEENDILINAYTVETEEAMDSVADIGCVAFVTSDTINPQEYIKTLELDKACTEL